MVTMLGWALLLIAGWLGYNLFVKKKWKSRAIGMTALFAAFLVVGLNVAGTQDTVLTYLPTGVGSSVGASGSSLSVTTPGGGTSVSGDAVPISTLSVVAKQTYADTAVTTGILNFYDPTKDPNNPNVNPIQNSPVGLSVGSNANGTIKTGTPYRIVYDGGATFYDKDLGVMTLDSKNYNYQTGRYLLDLGNINAVATIDDFCNEVKSGDGSGGSKTCLNGNPGTTNMSAIALRTELVCASSGAAPVSNCSADSVIHYNSTIGDGVFDTYFTFSVSSANTVLQDAGLCFTFDSTNPPSGGEITALTASLDSGTDLGVPSDILSYWRNQLCVPLGSGVLKAGTTATYKLTWTVSEALLDTNADFTVSMDDLTKKTQKPLANDIVIAGSTPTKATRDLWSFGGQDS